MPTVPPRSETLDDIEDGPSPTPVAADGSEGSPVDGDGDAEGRSPIDRWPPKLVGAGLLALLALPLIVALVALRQPQWYPILDLAMTELRVRDVGTRATPLIGLPGRIGVLGQEQGSHPGPISFWMLAPTYRIFGSTAWALQVATVVLHTVAVGAAMVLAYRRGGTRLVLGVAAALAILLRSYGPGTLTEPWNPYMPLLWWFVLLLAVWSVLNRDLIALPVAVFAASVCAQTHVPYTLLVAGMGGLALVGVGMALRGADSEGRRRTILGWLLVAAVVGGLLWLPPVVDQIRREPGNISLLIDHFATPPQETVGLGRGIEMVLLHLDPWRMVTGQDAATGSLVDASQAPRGTLVPGVLMFGAWVASVVLAWRLRHAALLRLHLVLGVALLLAVVSISRIFGQLWYYLMIWAWGIHALMLVAIGWSVAAYVLSRRPAGARATTVNAGIAALAAVTIVSTAVFAVEASAEDVPAEPLSTTMAALVPDAVERLADDRGARQGRDERYLVTWSDALYIGSQGIGLVNELDRHRFDVGVIEAWSVPVGRHRARHPSEATAQIHLATGLHVETWRDRPGFREIAYVDPRTPAQVEEFERTRTDVIATLRAEGLGELVENVDHNLFAAAIDPRVPVRAQDGMTVMLDLGLPTAIFVGPVEGSG